MIEPAHVVLATESETALPTGTGWVVLLASLFLVAVWLHYLYR